MKVSKARIALICFLGLLCGLMLARYLQRVPKRHYCDFRVYHHAAKVFLDRQDIYADDTPGITPFKYSPFFAFLVSPLGALPLRSAAAVFFIVNFIAAVCLFRFSVALARPGPGGVPWVYAFSILFTARFILLVWDSGQVPIIIGCLVLASLLFFSKGKDIPGAALLAGSILFKYLPAAFIPYFIVRRRFKAAILAILFLALWLLVPALYAGLAKNFSYLSSWLPSIIRTSLDQGSYFDYKNQSFISLVLRLASPWSYGVNLANLTFDRALLLAYALSFGLYLLALIPVKGRDTSRLDYALIFTFMPLFNPNGWMINFAVLAFPCAVLVSYLHEVKFKDVFVLSCMAASFAVTTFVNQEIVGRGIEAFFERCSCITVGALFLVAALVKAKYSVIPEREGAANG